MKNNVHIAILDDGVNEKYFDSISLANNLIVTKDLKIEKRADYNPYNISHGTICAGIIKKYNNNISISSIKILNDRGLGNRKKLIKALDWCIDNNIKIINLSLGSSSVRDINELRYIVDKAYKEGIIIIAANHNRNIMTYPASFYNVIGVKCDRKEILNIGEYIYNHQRVDGIEITACSKHYLINYLNNSYGTENVNSYAAPMITGIVSKIVQENPTVSLTNVKKILSSNAINKSTINQFDELLLDLSWINSALLFTSNEYSLKERYIFDVEDIVLFRNFSRDGIIKTVISYLEVNIHKLRKIDTIIIEYKGIEEKRLYLNIKKNLNQLGLDNKKALIINKQKAIGVVYDLKTDCKSLINHNAMLYKSKINIKNDNPLIAIIGDSEHELIGITDCLYDLFIKDYYNVLVLSNSFHSLYYGYRFIPFNNSMPNRHLEIVQKELELYNADIGMYILYNYQEDIKSYIHICWNLNFDIIVVYENSEFFKYYRDFILSCREKFIILTDNYTEEEKNYTINLLEKDYYNTLYKKILSRYCI
jgi:hypothetical protein